MGQGQRVLPAPSLGHGAIGCHERVEMAQGKTLLDEGPAKPEQIRRALPGGEDGEAARSVKIYQECLPSRHYDIRGVQVGMPAPRLMQRTYRLTGLMQGLLNRGIITLKQHLQRGSVEPFRGDGAAIRRAPLLPTHAKRSRAGRAPRVERYMGLELSQRAIHE